MATYKTRRQLGNFKLALYARKVNQNYIGHTQKLEWAQTEYCTYEQAPWSAAQQYSCRQQQPSFGHKKKNYSKHQQTQTKYVRRGKQNEKSSYHRLYANTSANLGAYKVKSQV